MPFFQTTIGKKNFKKNLDFFSNRIIIYSSIINYVKSYSIEPG